jgi:hypothetical protein
MYNTSVICTYHTDSVFNETDNITDDEKEFVRDVIYRQELCNIFGMEEFNETEAWNIIEQIYYKVKNYHDFSVCLKKVSELYPLPIIDESMALMYLFSYTYLYLTHACVSEFLEKNEITKESISKLLNEIENNR